MLFIAIFFIELCFLFFLSTRLTSLLFTVCYRLTRHKNVSIFFLTLLFFPGTLLHELAHALTARLLFVPVSHMEFAPKAEGNTLKMGSVSVARTDFFRRLLIGIAPFTTGTAALLGILFLAITYNLFETTLFLVLIGYGIFVISNTMFSSKKDLEGAIEFVMILFIVFGLGYFFNIRVPLEPITTILTNIYVQAVFTKGSLFLLVPLSIDLMCIILLSIANIFLKRRVY